MASGSDDGKVKLWALHASQSVCTIDARVNVSFKTISVRKFSWNYRFVVFIFLQNIGIRFFL